jgi:hypothetical protein
MICTSQGGSGIYDSFTDWSRGLRDRGVLVRVPVGARRCRTGTYFSRHHTVTDAAWFTVTLIESPPHTPLPSPYF